MSNESNLHDPFRGPRRDAGVLPGESRGESLPMILRTLLRVLAEKVGSVDILRAEEHVESEPAYRRTVGYESLNVRFTAR